MSIQECVVDYVIVDACKYGEDKVKAILEYAIREARKGVGRVFQIAVLCSKIDYTKYLLSVNEVTANNMDVRVELYEVSSQDGALKTLIYLAGRCRPNSIIKAVDFSLGEFDSVAKMPPVS